MAEECLHRGFFPGLVCLPVEGKLRQQGAFRRLIGRVGLGVVPQEVAQCEVISPLSPVMPHYVNMGNAAQRPCLAYKDEAAPLSGVTSICPAD